MTRESSPGLVVDYSTRREMEKTMMVVDADFFWSGQVIPPFRVTDEGGSMAASRRRVVL